jgi:hypothetical protein
VVTFGMGLHIPECEIPICQTLMEPAWIAVGLANGIYSWPKERDAASKIASQTHIVNAICVLMAEHGISAEEAEQRCRVLSADNVALYLETVERIKDDASLSLGLRKYIEAMQYSISGNIIWSKTCVRYNPGCIFNAQQLDWLANGVPEDVVVENEIPRDQDSVIDANHLEKDAVEHAILIDQDFGADHDRPAERDSGYSTPLSDLEKVDSAIDSTSWMEQKFLDCGLPPLDRRVRALLSFHTQ